MKFVEGKAREEEPGGDARRRNRGKAGTEKRKSGRAEPMREKSEGRKGEEMRGSAGSRELRNRESKKV